MHFDWKTDKAFDIYSEWSASGSLTLGVDRCVCSIETSGSDIESSTLTADQFHNYLALRMLRANLPHSTNSMRREDQNFSGVVHHHVTGISKRGENVSGDPGSLGYFHLTISMRGQRWQRENSK